MNNLLVKSILNKYNIKMFTVREIKRPIERRLGETFSDVFSHDPLPLSELTIWINKPPYDSNSIIKNRQLAGKC